MTDKERTSCIHTIESLRRLAYNVHGVMDVVDDQNCDKIIEMLNEPEQRWIPCSERLPDKKMCAFTLLNNGLMQSNYYDPLTQTGWILDNQKVIAWMPRPYGCEK